MDPATLVLIIKGLSAAAQIGAKLIADSDSVMSEDDAAIVKEALKEAQAATEVLRSQVDAALLAASKG